MNHTNFKTTEYNEEKWGKKYNGAPLPLEAYGILKSQKKDREKLKEYFMKTYDKSKPIEFKDKENVNMEKFFYMSKMKSNWTFGECKNALSIYPVLCSRADYYDDSKWVRISRENIGRYAGIWAGAVDKGIVELTKLAFSFRDKSEIKSLVQVREWKDGKRRGKEYLPSFFRYGAESLNPKSWQSNYIAFHTCIIEHGVWASLSRKAKALYLAMRSRSFFDQRAYQEFEGVYIPSQQEIEWELGSDQDYKEKKKYRNRKWDVCDKSLRQLFELARIPYKNTRELTNELIQAGLIERVHETKSIFLVYLKPKPLLKN